MTADIKQLADIARTDYPTLALIAFGHSMGSALTQSHIQNHGNLLAGAILCGTMGAMPGLDDALYQTIIEQLHSLATVQKLARRAQSSVRCWSALTHPSSRTTLTPPALSGRPATPRKSCGSKPTRCAENPSPTP